MIRKRFLTSLLKMLALILIAYPHHATNTAEAADLDCAPLDPRQEISKEIAADVEGAAKTLLKAGQAKGKIEGKFSEKIKSLQDKYPNSDQLVLKKNLLYFYCTFLNSAKDLSADKKIEIINRLTDKILDNNKPAYKKN